MIKKITLLSLFIAVLVGMYFLQNIIILQQEKVWLQKKIYLIPPPQYTKVLALGNDELVANLLWVRAIQYFGGNFSRMDGPGFKNLMDNITTLSPQFQTAYTFGGFAYTEGLGDYDAAVDLLMKGHENIPDKYKLPFDAGFIRFYNQERIDDAIELLTIAAKCPDAPSFVARMIPYLHLKNKRIDFAIEKYKAQLNAAQTDFEIQLIQNQLKMAYMKKDLIYLDEKVEEYQKKTNKDPDYFLEDLVKTGIIPQLPVEPHGGYYYWDKTTEKPDSIFYNYLAKKRMSTELHAYLERAKHEGREKASTLEDAVAMGIIPNIPEDPLGGGWGYDPATGDIKDVTISRQFAPSGLIPRVD